MEIEKILQNTKPISAENFGRKLNYDTPDSNFVEEVDDPLSRALRGSDLYESIPAGLMQHGYKLIPKGDSRRFKTFGTWEKGGVRIALSGNVLGVERGGVMVYQGDGDEMTLEALITDPKLRGQGRAKAALQDLTRIADVAGKVLYLEPVQLEKGIGPDRKKLQKMYSTAGFETIDSKGLVMSRSVSKGQQNQTDTPAFKNWFGDSKVIDTQDKPLVVYHGTNADITEFNVNLVGENFPEASVGFYFSSSPGVAGDYAKTASEYSDVPSANVMPVYLSIKNPYRLDGGDWALDDDSDLLRKIKSEGKYDGIVSTGKGGKTTYIVFNPTQIKSAIGNSKNFDASNPDIQS